MEEKNWLAGLLSDRARTTSFIIICLGPIVLYYIIFLFYPLISAFIWTFMDYNPIREENPFIGIGNYKRMIADPLFRLTLLNTFRLLLYIVPTGVACSLIIALALNKMMDLSRTIFTTAYFMPVITSMVACAAIWRWLYHPGSGLVNFLLKTIGLSPQKWLQNPELVLPAIAAMTIWKGMGFNAVIFLAALKGIPDTFYDAGKIDGATGWKTFWFITFPLLGPSFLFVMIMSCIGVFQIFTQIFVMTDGGPVHASRVLALYIYERGITYIEMGYASSMAYILFIIIMIFTLTQMKLLRTKWEY